MVVDVQDTSCKIESLANKKRKVVQPNDLKRLSTDHEIDDVYEENEDTESSDFEEIEDELPNREEQWDEQRTNKNANAMPRPYNLKRRPDRYRVAVVNFQTVMLNTLE